MAGHREGHPPIARLGRRAIGQTTAHPTLHVRSSTGPHAVHTRVPIPSATAFSRVVSLFPLRWNRYPSLTTYGLLPPGPLKAVAPGGDIDWCRAWLLDLVAAWDEADDDQRSRLVSALFESIDAEALPQRGLRLVAAPRSAWRGFFQSLVLVRETERETGVSRASTTGAHGINFAYRFGDAA